MFGLTFNYRSQYPVFGGVGLRWKFAEHWTLALLLPKPSVEYTVNEHLTLFAGGGISGGAFRVAKDFGNKDGQPKLNNSDVTYREMRVGSGARYRFNEHITLTADAGWMIDRRFEFDNGDLLLNGDGAPYVRVGVSGSF